MKKVFVLLSVILLTSCFSSKKEIQTLPDAELENPYYIKIDFSNGHRTYPERFDVTILPLDSGLSASKLTGKWDNETIISGTPKTRQDISIEIYYVIREPVGFFESHEQTKYYQIKVK